LQRAARPWHLAGLLQLAAPHGGGGALPAPFPVRPLQHLWLTGLAPGPTIPLPQVCQQVRQQRPPKMPSDMHVEVIPDAGETLRPGWARSCDYYHYCYYYYYYYYYYTRLHSR
jgi:hypothetical protein